MIQQCKFEYPKAIERVLSSIVPKTTRTLYTAYTTMPKRSGQRTLPAMFFTEEQIEGYFPT